MTDYYLKFADEAEATNALDGYEGSIDIIGKIYISDGTVNAEDVPNMQPIDGWYVNIRGEENEAIAAYAIDVLTPYRSWA